MGELARRIRAKYPDDYKDWADSELEQGWLEKYPQSTKYKGWADPESRIAAQNTLAARAKAPVEDPAAEAKLKDEYMAGSKVAALPSDVSPRESITSNLAAVAKPLTAVAGPAFQAIAQAGQTYAPSVSRALGLESQNVAAESDLAALQSDADRKKLARALAKATNEKSGMGTSPFGGVGMSDQQFTQNVYESMPLDQLQRANPAIMQRAQEILAQEKSERDATAESNRLKVAEEIQRVNSFPVTDDQRRELLEQGLQRVQRETFGNDHAEALRYGRRVATQTMIETKDPKAAMDAAQKATVAYYRTLLQAAKGRELGGRASKNAATYEQFIKTFSDPREFSRMAIQTGVPMAIAWGTGVGGFAMATRLVAQFYGTAATTATLQGLYEGKIDPANVMIESFTELGEIPAMDIGRAVLGSAAKRGIASALGDAGRFAGRTAVGAGVEGGTEALQTAGSEFLQTGRVISGPEALSAGTQGAFIRAGMAPALSAVERAMAPEPPVAPRGQSAFEFAPAAAEGEQLGLTGVDISLQEPALRNLAPPGGFQVPEDTQNKPEAAKGAEDPAEKRGRGIGSRIGEVVRRGVDYARKHPYEIGSTFIGGVGGGAVGGLAGGSIGAWGGRQVGRQLGKVGGSAADAERAAEAAAQNKPVAAVGADDKAIKAPTIEEALRALVSQAAEGQQAEVPAELAQRAGVAPLEAAEEEAPLARFIDASIRGDAVPGTEQVQMEMFGEQPVQQRGLFDQPTGVAETTPPPAGELPAPLGQGTAIESQFAETEAEPVAIPQRNIPPAVEGMIERAFDRHGPSGAIELAIQLGLDEQTATDIVAELGARTDAGERIATSEPVSQFEETTEPAAVAPQAEIPAARPGGPAVATEAMNLLDVIEQEAKRQAKESPKRPAVVEPKIPDEMARQMELAERARSKQSAREKEPGYEDRKTARYASDAFVDRVAELGKQSPNLTAKQLRAIVNKEMDAAEVAAKNKKEGEGLEKALSASVAAPAPPVTPAKEPTTIQELLNAGRVDEARAKARSEVSNPDETVTKGTYFGMKVGDVLPGGSIITEISGGLIETTTKPPKKNLGELRKEIPPVETQEDEEPEGGPITRDYARIAGEVRKAPPAEGSPFRSPQALKELGKLKKEAKVGVYAETGPAGAGRVEGEVRGDRRPQQVVPEASRGRDLEGLPATVKVNGEDRTYGGFKPAQDVASEYVEGTGRKYSPPKTYVKVDKDRAARIAAEYVKMKHDPENPDVKAAYEAMIRETLDQYDAILKTGLVVEFIEPGKDPYQNPRMAIDDVVQNNHLWVFQTDAGFGTDEAFDATKNPLLAPTTYKISGRVATANDIFRAVHDYFGHIKNGVGFRADGEENAWRSHSSMYSPLARRAMTTETRGQNSWLNYGPYGEKNRTAKTADTVFADQKTGLLPEWVSMEGAADPTPETPQPKGKKFAGMVRPDSFAIIDAWRDHARELGYTEEQIDSAERVFTETPQEPLAKKRTGKFDTVGFLNSEEIVAPGSKKLSEIFSELKGGSVTDLSEEDQVKAISDKMLPEMRHQKKQVNSGIGWYRTDIDAMEHALKNPQPELNDSEEMLVMKMITAATSFGQDPNMNLESALTIYRAFKESGQLAERQESGKQWPGRPGFEVNAKKFTLMSKELGGMKALAKWMSEKQPISEIRRFNPNVKIGGKATDMQYGSYVLGPKGGPFFQNLIGNRDLVTGDRWDNRAMHRLMGTTINDKSTLAQRSIFNKASEIVAKKLGVDQADLQAMRWFFEKGLYEALGVKGASPGTYSVAGRRAAEGVPLKEGKLTARSPLQEESKSIATEVKFGADSPYGKKYNWSSLPPEQQRKVNYAHGKFLTEAIEASTGVKVERADPGKGVYGGEANPNWIVKVRGTPQQVEAAANLFGLGSQQDSVIASRKVGAGEGRVGLDVTIKTKGEDWAGPDFIEKVWAAYKKIAPDLAENAGASLEFDDGGVSIRMFNDSFADKGILTRAAAAIQSAINKVDPKATTKVTPQEFEVSDFGNNWSESAGGEAYREALRARGFADAEINRFVDGADASIEKAWNRYATEKGPLKKTLDEAVAEADIQLRQLEDLDMMEQKTGAEMKEMAREDPVAYALYSSTNVLLENFIRAAFWTDVAVGREMNMVQAYKGGFIPESTEEVKNWLGSRNPTWRGGFGQLRISRADTLQQVAERISRKGDLANSLMEIKSLLSKATNGDQAAIDKLKKAYKQELKETLAHEILHGFEGTVDVTKSKDPEEIAKMKKMQALMNKSGKQLLEYNLPDDTTLNDLLDQYFETKSMDKHWDAEVRAAARAALMTPAKKAKASEGLFRTPGNVRTSTKAALEGLEDARKPRKPVKGVLEHLVDLRPRIAPPAKPKAPLEGMVKG